MTTATVHNLSSHPHPAGLANPTAPAPAATVLRVRWPISPSALIAAPAAAAMLNGHAATLRRAALEWRISRLPSSATASCLLALELTGTGDSCGTTDHIILTDPAPAAILSAGPHEHIDIPGLLSLTIAKATGELLYARTSVLADRLALPGGVYEPPALA